MNALKRHLIIFVFSGMACYSVLIFLAQGQNLSAAIGTIPAAWIPFLLALAFVNYLLRYFRWEMYLHALGIVLHPWISFKIFMAGLTMTITPGKLGEALKAYLLKDQGEHPWSLGLPIVFAERLTDLVGLVLLVAFGLWALPVGTDIVIAGMILCLALIVISVNSSIFRFVVGIIKKLPGMGGFSQKLLEMHVSIRTLLRSRPLMLAMLLSFIAWFAECWILYFVLLPFSGEATWLQATFVYSLATLAGALSILPGGLVATEVSMAGLLVSFGLERSQAAVVTLIVRVCTLWFAVLLGMFFLALMQREIARRRVGELVKDDVLMESGASKRSGLNDPRDTMERV